MTKIYIILTLLIILFSLSCTDRIVYEEVSDYEDLNPVFSPPGPYIHNIPQTVTITTEVSGAAIRYTTDGSNPTPSSTIYDSPINVTVNNTTIKAQAFKDGWYPSDIISTNYQLKVATPVVTPEGGSFGEDQEVIISCATEGAIIRYSTDGNDPTGSSNQYTTPLSIDGNTTLKVKAFREGWTSSDIVTNSYQFSVATPVFKPPGGYYTELQTVTITCDTDGAIIRYTLNGGEPTDSSTQYTVPVNVPANTTLKAKAFKEDWTTSETTSAEYTNQIAGMVFVEGGTFNPSANYTVTLSSFSLSKYEVTQSDWTSVMGGIYDPDWSDRGQGPTHPAYRISWFDAVEYCNRLSIREGLTPAYSYGDSGTNPANWPDGWNNRDNHTNVSCNWNADGYRLPTEMEREFAARGGVPAQNAGTFNDLWAGTNVEADLGDYAWYWDNSDTGDGRQTHPVGTKLPNELGLYDMSGNVWNWVWDRWGNYPTGVHNNPTGPTTGTARVRRGGSWDGSAGYCTVSGRNGSTPSNRDLNLGFRLLRVAP